jgi:hypothetical protein
MAGGHRWTEQTYIQRWSVVPCRQHHDEYEPWGLPWRVYSVLSSGGRRSARTQPWMRALIIVLPSSVHAVSVSGLMPWRSR